MDEQTDAVTTLTRPQRDEVEPPDDVEPADDGARSIQDELRAAIVRKLRPRG